MLDRMLAAKTRISAGVIAMLLAVPAAGSAQEMGQGEANITARSDVQMRIESGPATSGRRLQALANAISAKMGDVRRCYSTCTEERPDITGQMRIRVTVPRTGRVQVQILDDSTEDRQLPRCVRRALEGANYRGLERPAIAILHLDFNNTAAQGVQRMAERRAVQDDVRVQRDPQGRLYATGGNGSGEVRFTVRAVGNTPQETVAATQRSVRAAIAGLLDCRRRAGRRGMNPEGEFTLRLAIPARGRVRIEPTNNTVQDSRAPQCAARALRRARFDNGRGGNVDLIVRWSGRRQLDVPVREN